MCLSLLIQLLREDGSVCTNPSPFLNLVRSPRPFSWSIQGSCKARISCLTHAHAITWTQSLLDLCGVVLHIVACLKGEKAWSLDSNLHLTRTRNPPRLLRPSSLLVEGRGDSHTRDTGYTYPIQCVFDPHTLRLWLILVCPMEA